MTFAQFFIAFIILSIFTPVYSIKCFNCAVSTEILNNGYERTVTPSCAHFDGSSTYIVDCPFSTMCSRIISTMYLQNGYEQRTLTLGCAKQKLSRHVLNNGKWKEEHSIEEIYSEECKTTNDNNLVGAIRTYCYCRGNLCNLGYRQNSPVKFYKFIILALFAIYTVF